MIGPRAAAVAVAATLWAGAPVGAQTTTTTTSPPPATTTPPTTAAPTTPATTAPAPTTAPPTTLAPTTTSSSTTTTSTSTTSTTTPAKTSGGTSAGTIAIAVVAGLVGLGAIAALIVVLVRRSRRNKWAEAAANAGFEAQGLSAEVQQGIPWLRDPNAAAQVWANVDARLGRLRAALRQLDRTAPDESRRAAVGRASQAVQALQASVETDRRLRVGPPVPSTDQLAYSEAILRQRAAELERAMEDLQTQAE